MTEVIQPSLNYETSSDVSEQVTELIQGAVRVPGTRDPIPYTIEMPLEPRSDNVLLLPPGFGAIKRHSRDIRHALAAEQGIATISYGAGRHHEKTYSKAERLFKPQKLHYQTIGRIIEDLQDNMNVQTGPNAALVRNARIALAPHSMGDLPGAAFAANNPDIVDSVTHISGVGSGGRLGARLIGRTVGEVCFDIVPAVVTGKLHVTPQVALQEIQYFVSDPLRTAGEIGSCLLANTVPTIEQTYKGGVYQAFVGLAYDRFFKPHETLDKLNHVLDYVTVVDCEHIGPQTEPSLVARSVGDIVINKPRN